MQNSSIYTVNNHLDGSENKVSHCKIKGYIEKMLNVEVLWAMEQMEVMKDQERLPTAMYMTTEKKQIIS